MPRLKSAIAGALSGWRSLVGIGERIRNLESQLRREMHRTDYVLAMLEGAAAAKAEYEKTRKTGEYTAPFLKEAPLVSVCVATMNRAELLITRCLRSLQNQTYHNLQIIVVGDHCTDDTGQRIAALRDDRIVFHNLPRRGPYPRPGFDRWFVAGTNAANEALARCEGDFVTHLDDDDRYSPNRIEVLVEAAKVHRSDFLWHSFWTEGAGGVWSAIGNGRFELGQITTGSIFYHRYFSRFPWDVFAYRLNEPGDWNRLRKIKILRPQLHFVDQPLLFHHKELNQRPFEPQPGETFLD